MYQTHFGLRQRPFPATPDPACYYPATDHERALARLLQELEDGEGLALLTGAEGTGKTLLCHCLLDRLGKGVDTAFLTNSHVGSRTALLQAILYDLSLPHEGCGEQELRLALTDHLLHTFADGRRTILLVDEAHHLTPDLLEELRLLGNLEARSGKALQLVLIGLPPLLETLRRPELTALRQRLAVRVCLGPLPLEEAADYLLHHLRLAGGRPGQILSEEAVELLARSTQGVPRLLNQAARQALVLAAEAGVGQVDAEAALEALALLDLAEAGEEAPAGPEERANGVVSVDGADQELRPLLPLAPEGSGGAAGDASCRLFVSTGRPA